MSWSRYLLDPANALIVNHKNFAPLIIGTLEAVDINNERDFRVAEEILRERAAQSAADVRPYSNDSTRQTRSRQCVVPQFEIRAF